MSTHPSSCLRHHEAVCDGVGVKSLTMVQRQMHQFIVSMERIAAQSAWTHQNRFDSFAPLRVNVAAQWLVDGVSHPAS